MERSSLEELPLYYGTEVPLTYRAPKTIFMYAIRFNIGSVFIEFESFDFRKFCIFNYHLCIKSTLGNTCIGPRK